MVERYSLVLFKPDALERQVRENGQTLTIAEVGRLVLVRTGLKVCRESNPRLTVSDVYTIYERVLRPNPDDDAIWGTAWKQGVVDHMISRPLDVLKLVDPVANEPIEKAQGVKRLLREQYGAPGDVIRNLLHVPDNDELEYTHAILFAKGWKE